MRQHKHAHRPTAQRVCGVHTCQTAAIAPARERAWRRNGQQRSGATSWRGFKVRRVDVATRKSQLLCGAQTPQNTHRINAAVHGDGNRINGKNHGIFRDKTLLLGVKLHFSSKFAHV